MASYVWRKYADYLYTKCEKTFLWDMVEPYRRPKSFTPVVVTYVAAFYTGVIGAAVTEQLYKEKYWEKHPGVASAKNNGREKANKQSRHRALFIPKRERKRSK
ncbi:unnamed protein product [Lathyrus oleraceus]